LFDLNDCLAIHAKTGVPILFDTFHHEVLPTQHSLSEALQAAAATWARKDGPPMIDYSSQMKGARRGCHSETLDEDDFETFLETKGSWDGDVMLEIKDKEKSALKAVALATVGSNQPKTIRRR
jgi:UV DNA damage endonuclease